MAALGDFSSDLVVLCSAASLLGEGDSYPQVCASAAETFGRKFSWREFSLAYRFAFHGLGVTADGDIPCAVAKFFEAKFRVDGAGEVGELDDKGEHFHVEGFGVATDWFFGTFVGFERAVECALKAVNDDLPVILPGLLH